MKEIDLLSHVYKTSEMGRDGIATVRRHARDPELLDALDAQDEEYRKLQDSAGRMLMERGIQPDGIGAMAKMGSEMMGTMQTIVDHSATKIAEMMIQGNTMGMTKSLRTIRDCNPKDGKVRDLADKLLKTEEANIQEMKGFL